MPIVLDSSRGLICKMSLQKEACFAGAPALVMMPDTGWIELVEAGWNVLVDADKDLIVEKAFNHKPSVTAPENLYGDGKAGEKIADILMDCGL